MMKRNRFKVKDNIFIRLEPENISEVYTEVSRKFPNKRSFAVKDSLKYNMLDLNSYLNDYFYTAYDLFWEELSKAYMKKYNRNIKVNKIIEKRVGKERALKMLLSFYLPIVLKGIIDSIVEGDIVIFHEKFKLFISNYVKEDQTLLLNKYRYKYKYIDSLHGVYPVLIASIGMKEQNYDFSVLRGAMGKKIKTRVVNRIINRQVKYYK